LLPRAPSTGRTLRAARPLPEAFGLMPVIAALLFEFCLRELRQRTMTDRADRELSTLCWLHPAEAVRVQLSDQVLKPGRHSLRFEFEPTAKPDMTQGKGAPGRLQLYLDGTLAPDGTVITQMSPPHRPSLSPARCAAAAPQRTLLQSDGSFRGQATQRSGPFLAR
jgi:hypothetical protein